MTHRDMEDLRTYRNIKRALLTMDALCRLAPCLLKELEGKTGLLYMHLCASYVKVFDIYPNFFYMHAIKDARPALIQPNSLYVVIYKDKLTIYISDSTFACYLNEEGDVSCIPII